MMEIELSGTTFPVRGDLRAIKNAQEEHNVRLEDMEANGSLVDIGTLLFHFARRGCELRKVSFTHDHDEFLGLIELSQLKELGKLVESMMGGSDSGKKK
jgi:hypothetical protein